MRVTELNERAQLNANRFMCKNVAQIKIVWRMA